MYGIDHSGQCQDLTMFLKIFITFIFMTNMLAPYPSTALADLAQIRQKKYGGTLVWGTSNPPTIINPILTSHSVSAPLMALIFDSLVRINSQGKVVPGLAKSWDISEDGLVYIFYLHEGVKFHDGVELTTKDIKFTYDMIADSKNQSPRRTNTELIEQWKIIDNYTVKIKLKKAFPAILHKLTREIAPKHLLSDKALPTASFNYFPIGTGPFKFKKWDKKTNQITLEANQKYFENRPYLDQIIIKTYPNAKKLWIALMQQEVDLVLYLNHEDYKIVAKDPTFKTYTIPWEMYFAMVYNTQDSTFFNPDIRNAIAMSIDRKQLMQATSVEGLESTGPFHPKSMGFNSDVRSLPYNPLRARMNLMHLGWKDIDGDGVFEKGRKKLELRLLVDIRNDFYKKAAIIIRQQLAEIGMKVQIIPYKNNSDLTKNFLTTHKPQAWLRFFEGLGHDAYDALGSWYSSSSQFGQLWPYKNNKIDMLFESGRIIQNKNERSKIYQEIHKLLYLDQPACFFFFPQTFHAVSAKLKNTDDFFCWSMPVHSLKNWQILHK